MPKLKNLSVLIDYAHGEILNFSDRDYIPFKQLLEQMGVIISVNNSGKITQEILNVDVLIIGCPLNHYFLHDEIKLIIDFIMEGGNLLVISEYGGDAVQKTNLNDLTKFFGIYFENTAIRSNTETGTSSLPMIIDFSKHEINKNIRKIVLGGCCSLRIAKNAMGICFSGKETWLEIYDNLNNIWIKNEDNSLPLIAAATYGQGRVVAIGDIEICSSNARFGLNALDNKKLIQNIFLWFQQPVKYETTIDWIMGQFAVQRDETLNLNNIFNNLINTIKGLEERITKLEEKLKLN